MTHVLLVGGDVALLEGLAQLARSYDLVVADGSAGIGPDVLSFATAADHVLLVTTPEPTSRTTYSARSAAMGTDERRCADTPSRSGPSPPGDAPSATSTVVR